MSEKLASEQVIVPSAGSFSGSAQRVWRAFGKLPGPTWLSGLFAMVFVLIAWGMLIVCWVTFGIFMIPAKIAGRSRAKRKRDALRHRELLERVGEHRP